MTVIARISGIFRDKLPPGLFKELLAIYPEGQPWTGFCSFLPLDDPRTQAILRCLIDYGLTAWQPGTGERDRTQQFSLMLERIYDLSDFIGCEWIELGPTKEGHISDAWRGVDGLWELSGNPLRKRFDFVRGTEQCYFIPDGVRNVLEKASLQGLIFRETIPMVRDSQGRSKLPNWTYWGKPWWELDTDATMPPLAPSMTFTDSSGKPAKQGEYSNGFHRKEGLYVHAELHYRASDLVGLSGFDLARTAEPFGNRKGFDRIDCPLVASRRFYDVCVAAGLKVDWAPVRVDPD